MTSIADLERIAAAHWRGTEEEWLGHWLLRAADGFTGRANSALPLGDPGLPVEAALAAVTGWYRARGLPPMISVPLPLTPDSAGPGPAALDGPALDGPALDGPALDAELTRRSWLTRPAPAFVMVADVPAGPAPGNDLPAGLEVRADPAPDAAWLARYHYRGQENHPPVMRAVLMSAADQVFTSIRSADPDDDDAALAIARLSFAAGWAGLSAVEVSPERRRTGLGRALTSAAFALAAARGVRRVFLQVEVSNVAARALYERSGFRCTHRYHYRIAPD